MTYSEVGDWRQGMLQEKVKASTGRLMQSNF